MDCRAPAPVKEHMTLIDTILLAALVGLLIAAYLDSRPHLQFLLAADPEQPSDHRSLKALGYFSARKRATGAVKRSGTLRDLGDGRWQLRGELPKSLNGRRRRYTRNFHGTKREAERALAQLLKEIETQTILERPVTVNDLLDRWLSEEVEPTVRHATYLDYQRKANTYVRPLIGDVKLTQLTSVKVEQFRNALLKRRVHIAGKARGGKKKVQEPAKISHTTVKSALKVLSMSLNYARRHKFIASNPLHDLKRMKWQGSGKKKALTAEELSAFLQAAQGNYWFALFAMLSNTGIRPSEALGLKWGDIDWENGWINIERKLTLLPGGVFTFDDPKTEDSKRPVPLSPKMAAILQAHLKRQEELRAYDQDLDLVFGDLSGQPADSRNILRRHTKPIAKRAGIKRSVTLYSLRYSFMTHSTNMSRAPKLTSRVMGHKTVTFSEDVYNDPDDEALRESTRHMDEFLPDTDVDSAGEEAA